MLLRKFNYQLKQAFSTMGRNKLMAIIAISTVMFCLILLGIAILFGMNLNFVSDQLQAQFEIQAYVEEFYSEDQALELGNEIKRIDGIKTIVFENKDQALENAHQMMDEDMLAGLDGDNNPLRHCYKVTLNDINKAQSVANQLGNITGIAYVDNRTDIIGMINSVATGSSLISLVAMLLFSVLAIFLISNTIRLAVMARRREIEIMKLVGATDWFIRWPFIIEGALFGIVGGLVALIPLYFGYENIANTWNVNNGAMFKFLQFGDLHNLMVIVLLVFGCIIGSFGSVISIRKYLHI